MGTQIQKVILIAAFAASNLAATAATNQFSITASSNLDYTINSVNDPDLTLVRGFSYDFNINVSAIHPFYIKTAQATGSGSQYNDGVSGNQGVTSGTITFTVPGDAPDTLHYQCGNHFNMHGLLNIVDPPEVLITDFSVGTNVVIQSTGTDPDTLNLNVMTSTNLTTNIVWSVVAIQSNSYSNGTNTTHLALPAGNAAFFRVQHGFF